MQINKLALLPFFISSVLAVPAVVTVTQHVHKETTVVVRGSVYITNGQTFTTYYTDDGAAPTTTTTTTPKTAATPQITTVNNVVSTVAEGTTVLQPISTTSTYTSVITTPSTSTTAGVIVSVSIEQEDDTTTTTAATATTTTPTSTTTVSSFTSTSSATSNTDILSDNASILLSAHNNKRSLHKDTPSLTWSTELETYAQNYADQYDCSGTLVHSGGPYGENLALGYGIEGSVDAWYNEIEYYDYNNPGFSENAGHFTQVVWKSSTEVGCGIKSCGGVWGDYVICSYKPAGNVIGEFAENVMPLV